MMRCVEKMTRRLDKTSAAEKGDEFPVLPTE
jgi:hypothetical protein